MQIQADSDPIRRFLCIILNDDAPSFFFLLLVNTCQYCVTYCSRRLKHIKKILDISTGTVNSPIRDSSRKSTGTILLNLCIVGHS